MSQETIVGRVVCSKCDKAKDVTKATAAGEPRLPFKWVREGTEIVCIDCKTVKPVRNYSYRVFPPTGESLHLVDEQMRLAARMRNALVAAELDRRKKTDEALAQANQALSAVDTLIASLDVQIEEIRTQVSNQNAAARKKVGATPEQKVEVARLKGEQAKAYAERKRIRTELFGDPATRATLARIESDADAETKRLYAQFGTEGLYWGTRCHVLEIANGFRSGPPPKFVRFQGGGHIASPLQGGGPVVSILEGEDLRFRVDVAGEGKNPWATLSVRVGSTTDPRPKPIWAEFRTRFYRPFPPGAAVKTVKVIRRREAYADHWVVVVAVEGGERPDDRATTGAVGVDVGWRRLPDGRVRVAAAVGSDGHRTELCIPASQVSARLQVDDLDAIRQKLFNTTHARLVEWVKANPLPAAWTEETPDNPRPVASHLAQWKSKGRLFNLVLFWEQNRFPGDEEIFGDSAPWQEVRLAEGPKAYSLVVKAAANRGVLLAWMLQELHLARFAAGRLRRTTDQRLYAFRQFSCELRRRYGTAVVEDMNIRADLLQKPKPEEDVQLAHLRKLHRVAAPGLLKQILKEQMRVCLEGPPELTTKRCHACDNVCDFDAGATIDHTCEHCGVTWDQDFNAAEILVRMAGTV